MDKPKKMFTIPSKKSPPVSFPENTKGPSYFPCPEKKTEAEHKPMEFRARPMPLGKKKKAEKIFGLERHWLYLAVGLVLAPIFKIPGILNYMGWFFESLVHEIGHCAVAYFFGCIAIPAIRLDGHACAIHRPQSMALALLVWAALAAGAFYFWKGKRNSFVFLLGSAALLYPLLAFTRSKELLHLLGGHGGELIFSAVFFWRTLVGGFYEESERPLYSMIAWYLWMQNIFLCWNLMYSPETRNWYLSHGSFGLENDYIRVADMLSWSLTSVAGMMFFISLFLPPLGLLWGWWSYQEEAA